MKKNNFLGVDAQVDFFTLFRRTNYGILTVNWGVKAHTNARINDGLFKLFGYGNGAFVGEDNPAVIDMSLNAIGYQELAVGYQINITDKLSLGWKGKLLLGVANVKTDAGDVKLITDADSYALRMQEHIALRSSFPGVFYINDAGGLATRGKFNIGDLFQNPGFAVDFAAEYRFDKQWSAVAAVIVSDKDYREQFMDTLGQYFHIQWDSMGGYNTMLNANLLLRANYDLNPCNRFSAQLQGRFMGSGFRPALTLAYCGSFWNNVNVCVTYTMMPHSYDNIGLGFSWMIETCNIYLTTNNLIGCFKPLNASGFNAQVGIVFNLWLPERRYVKPAKQTAYME